jgi:hypothetical protein
VNGSSTDLIITVCGDGSYCCGEDNVDCCDHGAGFWVSNHKVYPYTSSPFTSLLASSSTTMSSSLPTSAMNSTCDTDGSRTNNVALGVGLAVGIPMLMLLASIFLPMAKRNSSAVKYYAADAHHGSVNEVFRKTPLAGLAELPHFTLHRSELDAR